MTAVPPRGNGNVRGNSKDRKARREWIMATFDTDLGTAQVRCAVCQVHLNIADMQIGRIVPGARGGRYTRDNIRPVCGPCNRAMGFVTQAEIHAETCRGMCRRCRMVTDYRAAREAAELAREAATASYAAEEAAYGKLITYRDWLIANAG